MPLPDSITLSDILKFRQDQFRDLRVELGQLKTCQSNAIFWGVTGTSVLISLLTDIGKDIPYQSLLRLIPLAILFPSWLIFFDKARTIARINGYLRVQEGFAVQGSKEGLFGWESALSGYWKHKSKFTDKAYLDTVQDRINCTPLNRKKLSSYIYWLTTFGIFLSLSIVCILLSAITFEQSLLVYLILFINATLLASMGLKVWRDTSLSFAKMWDNLMLIWAVVLIFELVCVIIALQTGVVWSYQLDILGGTENPYQNPTFETFFSLVVFSAACLVFIGICLSSFYILYNLIRGRYLGCSYECRWRIVLDAMDKDPDVHENTPLCTLLNPTSSG